LKTDELHKMEREATHIYKCEVPALRILKANIKLYYPTCG